MDQKVRGASFPKGPESEICKLWKRTGKLESGGKQWKWTGSGVNYRRGRES